ncbi:type II secretion system F family protein [Veillonella intestinalis]|uniref:type II secretion system F family protein n=1 Tax=Veillonella intestinalis TaxID=2941341 RepID=UPI002041341D|nr:type II secretion system F family protein [Veillonella intestinalis]
MKCYSYRAFDAKGVIQEDTMWAEASEEVVQKLRHRGFQILSLHIAKETKTGNKKWAYKDIVEFSYRMSLLLEAGISIRRVMQFLSDKPTKRIPYKAINEAVQRGHVLSEVLGQLGFPTIGCALLQAGEAAGTLGNSFGQIKGYYEKQMVWQRQISSAAAYPLFLLGLMLLFIGVAVGFILPAFKKVFMSMQVPLPWLTKLLFSFGDFVTLHAGLCSALLLSVGTFIWWLWQQSKFRFKILRKFWQCGSGHEWFDCFYLARLTKVWAILLDSGLTITEMLNLTGSLWGNPYAEQLQHRVCEEISHGRTLGESLKEVKLGNEFLWELVMIGEETGDMGDMLHHGATYYEQLTNRYMNKLQQMLEPIMVSLMGIGVAILVIAVMLPMFNAVTAMQNV